MTVCSQFSRNPKPMGPPRDHFTSVTLVQRPLSSARPSRIPGALALMARDLWALLVIVSFLSHCTITTLTTNGFHSHTMLYCTACDRLSRNSLISASDRPFISAAFTAHMCALAEGATAQSEEMRT
jgi:hypothetical protein